jgi:hypothetical protein
VRDLANEEHIQFSDFVFEELARLSPDEEEELNVYSMKTFISNSIDYIYD